MQDNATAHTANRSMEELRSVFDDRIFDWPPRSPDLNPCDFYLWEMLKEKVYANNPHTLEELEESIRLGISTISATEIRQVFNNVFKRCQASLAAEEVEKFKYLGATVTNINDIREEIKHTINMGNACYYSVEKLLSSSLLSKNLKVRIYKTVILPGVLYGCETWTLTWREEHRLRVFENKVLRNSPDIIRNIKSRRLRWAGHEARMGESRNAYRVLVGRPEGKRSLGRPRRRWKDNIKMDLKKVGYNDRDWINLAQDRDQWQAYMRVAMNLRLP
ncbi:hypothetical protein ANN_18976 [Periplaneta americana]|uniref:Uncharacterized protein n=1 Tax=Periplaneta americana TaxID=6978 RepID=A0ABQ8SQ93_PERAM|nr:hypothetical protein ANN_18976 [Periplaneta americana]